MVIPIKNCGSFFAPLYQFFMPIIIRKFFIVNVEQYLLTYGISKVVLILNERDIAENSL